MRTSNKLRFVSVTFFGFCSFSNLFAGFGFGYVFNSLQNLAGKPDLSMTCSNTFFKFRGRLIIFSGFESRFK